MHFLFIFQESVVPWIVPQEKRVSVHNFNINTFTRRPMEAYSTFNNDFTDKQKVQ